MRVFLPAHGGHDLDGQRGDPIGQDAELIVLGLAVEDLEAGNRDNPSLDAVVVGEVLGGLDADRDFRAGRDEGDLGTLDILENVPTLLGLLDDRALELGKVLAGESKDAGGLLVVETYLIGGARLVAVSRSPDHAVGKGTEVGEGLDRLVGRAVLAETNGIVGGDPEAAHAGERREADSTGGVGDEVEESTAIGDDGSVGGHTVQDSTHAMLANTEADVSA